MPDHPSIQGLREAVGDALLKQWHEPGPTGPSRLADAAIEAQAAYLTEHGVLLSGEGLVRAEEIVTNFPSQRGPIVVLVPVEGSE